MMNDTAQPPRGPSRASDAPTGEARKYRPRERFWPYVDVPEEPTDEEVAAIDPDLRAELFGQASCPFSITITFPRFDADDYPAAVELAKASDDYRETGSGDRVRHRARYRARDVAQLKNLWDIVGRLPDAEVLIDDRPVPYARQLWLPLCWFLLSR
jgi:hypothetical protein